MDRRQNIVPGRIDRMRELYEELKRDGAAAINRLVADRRQENVELALSWAS